jgi:putative copper export protein
MGLASIRAKQFVYWILLLIHMLASAAWFGAMFYSLAVLHPRARAFFGDAKRFEEFISHVAAGARWKVLGGCLLIALTGAALMFFPAAMNYYGITPRPKKRPMCGHAGRATNALNDIGG